MSEKKRPDLRRQSLRVKAGDEFTVDGHSIYFAAIDSGGVAATIKSAKKNKRVYVESKRGHRLASNIEFIVERVSDNHAADIVLRVPHSAKVRHVGGELTRLRVTRYCHEQMYFSCDDNQVVLTVEEITSTHIRYSIKEMTKGGFIRRAAISKFDNPIPVWGPVMLAVAEISMKYQSVGLRFFAPKHVRIDRHEVHLRRQHEFDAELIIRPRKKPNQVKEDVNHYRLSKYA